MLAKRKAVLSSLILLTNLPYFFTYSLTGTDQIHKSCERCFQSTCTSIVCSTNYWTRSWARPARKWRAEAPTRNRPTESTATTISCGERIKTQVGVGEKTSFWLDFVGATHKGFIALSYVYVFMQEWVMLYKYSSKQCGILLQKCIDTERGRHVCKR